jgi:hypothetical protein
MPAFKCRLLDELLDGEIFYSLLREARIIIRELAAALQYGSPACLSGLPLDSPGGVVH